MMALVHIQLLLLVEIINPHPGVPTPAGHKAPLVAVQRHACNLVGRFDSLQQSAWFEAVEEIGRLAGCDAQHASACAAVGGEGVELAAADYAFEVVFVDGGARAEVPPADLLVVGGGDEDVEIGAPDYALDCAAVDAGADLVAWRGGGG